MALKVGTRVNDKYEILKVIDTGGMSTVYIALDLNLNKNWALKEIIKEPSKMGSIQYRSLITETSILKKLDHVYLPRIVDIIENDERIFVVMDYIEGKTFEDIVRAEGSLPQDKVVKWAKQLTQVVGYLHSRTTPIIYRDMKPSNIMLQPNGNIKLFDFGASRLYEGEESWKTDALGTKGYAAPERYSKGEIAKFDVRSDIYEMGMTFYCLLTGHDPQKNPEQVKPITEWDETLNKGLEKIITKMTERDPDKRYQSTSELLYDLDTYKELDSEYKIKLTKRLKVVAITTVATVAFTAIGLAGIYGSISARDFSFEDKLTQSEQTNDSSIAVEATEIKRGSAEPYNLMLKLYKQDGEVTDIEEIEILSGIRANKTELIDSGEYAEVAYDLSRTLFFWNSNENKAMDWLDESIANSKKDNLGAEALRDVINYSLGSETLDSATVERYWESFKTLISEQEEIDREYLLVTNLTYVYINTHADGLKDAGVSKDEIQEVIEGSSSKLDSLEPITDSDSKIKNELLSQVESLSKTVKGVFNE